jgi:SH3-like domain-containing protein
MFWNKKYLKYKFKYLQLKNQIGGSFNIGDRVTLVGKTNSYYNNGTTEPEFKEGSVGTIINIRERYKDSSAEYNQYQVHFDGSPIPAKGSLINLYSEYSLKKVEASETRHPATEVRQPAAEATEVRQPAAEVRQPAAAATEVRQPAAATEVRQPAAAEARQPAVVSNELKFNPPLTGAICMDEVFIHNNPSIISKGVHLYNQNNNPVTILGQYDEFLRINKLPSFSWISKNSVLINSIGTVIVNRKDGGANFIALRKAPNKMSLFIQPNSVINNGANIHVLKIIYSSTEKIYWYYVRDNTVHALQGWVNGLYLEPLIPNENYNKDHIQILD